MANCSDIFWASDFFCALRSTMIFFNNWKHRVSSRFVRRGHVSHVNQLTTLQKESRKRLFWKIALCAFFLEIILPKQRWSAKLWGDRWGSTSCDRRTCCSRARWGGYEWCKGVRKCSVWSGSPGFQCLQLLAISTQWTFIWGILK